MARYFFDLHADGAAQWDHAGTDYADRADVERHAGEMIAGAILKRAAQGGRGPITLSVHEGSGGIVLTAQARPGAETAFTWS